MKEIPLTATALAVGFGLLSIATAGPPKGGSARVAAHGASIEVPAGKHQRNDTDGRVQVTETATVTLEGRGARNLTGVIDDEPVAAGGAQKATITDGGKTSVFSYAPSSNGLTIEGGGASTTVVRNPDQTYSVDGVAAADGKAAVALLHGKPAWKAASPHTVVLAYSYAQHPNLAALGGNKDCDISQGPCATPPAVCTLFEDFCECAVCDKTDNAGACDSCR